MGKEVYPLQTLITIVCQPKIPTRSIRGIKFSIKILNIFKTNDAPEESFLVRRFSIRLEK